MSATIISFTRRSADRSAEQGRSPASIAAVILPRVDFFGSTEKYLPPGMTEGQVNLVWRAMRREPAPREALHRFCKATQRRITLSMRMEAAIQAEHQELMAAMWRHYPAAARRIMRRLRKVGGPVPSAVDEAGSPR
jgi:hypothetical protein